MNLLQKLVLKTQIETKFILTQRLGWMKVSPDTIPKYKLIQYLPENPVIIDAGAHVGADSIELSRIFKNARIHSFEPVPFIFNNLKTNTKKYKNITCYPLALSSDNGHEKMYLSSGESDASSSLLKPQDHLSDHPDTFFNESITVETMTLDTWRQLNKIDHIDFMWLDMQGHELNVLKASPETIKHVKAIHTEVSLGSSYEGAPLYPVLKAWLENSGFEVAIEALGNGADMGNVLFVRK